MSGHLPVEMDTDVSLHVLRAVVEHLTDWTQSDGTSRNCRFLLSKISFDSLCGQSVRGNGEQCFALRKLDMEMLYCHYTTLHWSSVV